LVEVFGKGTRFANGRGPDKIACAKDGFVDNIESGGCVAGKGECKEIDCETILNQEGVQRGRRKEGKEGYTIVGYSDCESELRVLAAESGLKINVEVVSFARVGVHIVLKVLVVASGSDECVGFRVHRGRCSCTAGVVRVQVGLCALLVRHQRKL